MALLGSRLKYKLILVCFRMVLILTQDRCTVCAEKYHRLRNCFGGTGCNSKVMWVMWNLVLVHLEIELVSMQNSCMACTKRNIGT
jgi:hypothetical protein